MSDSSGAETAPPSFVAQAMLKLGLTGGIAVGKTSVARLLADKGAEVLDADGIAHQTYAPGGAAYADVLAIFGSEILTADGLIDRRELGRMAFADSGRMARLNKAVWPRARQLVVQRLNEAEDSNQAVFVLEAALLLEAGWRDLVDLLWYVRAPEEVVRARLAQRGLSALEAEARIQSREDQSLNSAVDAVIDNDSDLAKLKERVDALWLTLPI